METLRVLMVEDSEDDAEMLRRQLQQADFALITERVQTAKDMKESLSSRGWDIVISDFSLPSFDAPKALDILLASGQDIPFIVVSGSIGEDTAVRMMRAGAHDYILKQNLTRLGPAVRRELREAENRRSRRSADDANRRLEAERAELLVRLKQENEDLTALTRITANAISHLELDGLLQTLLDRVVEVMGVDEATVLLAEGEELRVRASAGVASLGASTTVKKVGEGFAGSVASLLKPVYVEDAMTDPTIQEPLIRARGLRSLIGVPLKRHGLLIGVLHAGWLTVRPRREREIHMLEITAERCAAAIQNARLYHEARATAAKLQASEERFRQIAEAIEDVFWMTDPSGNLLYVSPAYEKVWGRSCASLYASPRAWMEAIHPDDRGAVEHGLQSIAISGCDLDYRIIRPDGEIRFIHDGAVAVRSAEGRVHRIVGVAEDVTSRRAAEEARRASDERFRTIFEAEPECVKVVGEGSELLQMNPAGLAMLEARSIDEVRGHTLRGFVLPEYRKAFDELLEGALAGGTRRLEFEILGLRGGRRWLETHATPLPDPDGATRMMLAVTRDVTESRRAQEALVISLREKEALLKEVHHRVKNNLQVIASLLRLEGSRNSEPGAHRLLKDMQGRIQSMALLHETLYRSANFAAVDLGGYLTRLANQLFRTVNLNPAVRIEVDMARVEVGIDQAIPCGLLAHELIANCLKHGFPEQRKGMVRLQLSHVEDGPALCLRVSDTGVGLPAGFEARVGDSLGLQLVQDLTRQLGGRLDVEATEEGASFAVTFRAEAPRILPETRGEPAD